MYGCDSWTINLILQSWVLKNWCFWTVVLEKTLESPLHCKEIQQVHPKGNQFWIFTGRTDVEVEAPMLWSPDAKNWLIGKDPDAGKDWRQEEKRMTKDEVVGWHHLQSWDGWTWVWASSGSWWWTGKPGVLQFMGSQRVGHDWVIKLNWNIERHLECVDILEIDGVTKYSVNSDKFMLQK